VDAGLKRHGRRDRLDTRLLVSMIATASPGVFFDTAAAFFKIFTSR
jgi:hypothetical protein